MKKIAIAQQNVDDMETNVLFGNILVDISITSTYMAGLSCNREDKLMNKTFLLEHSCFVK